ncbi:peptidylprolyl isomerase [Alloprevotella tannerae]
MKLKLSFGLILLSLFAVNIEQLQAQSANDPVIMTINGRPILRSEFEYSYNKNGKEAAVVEKKSVDEYAEMFLNYKLKVAAAERACIDTTKAFKDEFRTYRDLQLTPFMVDQAFIDSTAIALYDNMKTRLGGKDLLRPAHILFSVKQNATAAEKETAKMRADSVYQVIMNGGNFAALAKEYSGDLGSALRGGEISWIGPGATVKEFEEAAYKLKVGEVSQPVLTPFGYHIIKMQERKQLEPYAELRDQILYSLKQQGVDEISANEKISRIIAESKGRLTREAVMDSLLRAHDADLNLKYLIQEYHDGLLLFQISKDKVWDEANQNDKALNALFKQNKRQYSWTEPRFKGFVIHCSKPEQVKLVKKVLKKSENGDWQSAITNEFNKDSVTVVVAGPNICKKGENPYVDEFAFGIKGSAKTYPKFIYTDVFGKILNQPKSYQDVRSMVISDWQDILERQWIGELRKTIPYSVDKEVLKTVNKHN